MVSKTIKYTDYDGNEREETHYFHLSRADFMDLQYSVKGGMQARLSEMVEKKDSSACYHFFIDLIKKSYGVKSADGRRFSKTEEAYQEFRDSLAYDEFLMSLVANDAAEGLLFLRNLLPSIPESSAD